MLSNSLLLASAADTGLTPVIRWTMDNISGSTIYDEYGTYDATIVGSYSSITGVIGNGLDTIDVNSYITIPNFGDWFEARDNWTMKLKAKPCDDITGTGFLFCVSNTTHASPFYRVYIWFSPTELYARTGSYVAPVAYKAGTYNTATWYDIALTHTTSGGSSVNKLYLGETLVATTTLSALSDIPVSTCHPDAMFGRIPANNSTSNAASVKIDHVDLYDWTLSDTEIADAD